MGFDTNKNTNKFFRCTKFAPILRLAPMCDKMHKNHLISDNYREVGKRERSRGYAGRGGSGAQGRIRTTDTRIFSPLLYQLSYLGMHLS